MWILKEKISTNKLSNGEKRKKKNQKAKSENSKQKIKHKLLRPRKKLIQEKHGKLNIANTS